MKYKLLPILLSVLLLFGCASPAEPPETSAPAPSATYTSIPMSEAIERMAIESDFILLDVRRPDEFSAGHIAGAINIPNESIGDAEISALPHKDQRIYVYCRSGRRSKEASEKLVKLGYTNIVEIGGILDYTGALVP